MSDNHSPYMLIVRLAGDSREAVLGESCPAGEPEIVWAEYEPGDVAAVRPEQVEVALALGGWRLIDPPNVVIQ